MISGSCKATHLQNGMYTSLAVSPGSLAVGHMLRVHGSLMYNVRCCDGFYRAAREARSDEACGGSSQHR